MNSVFQPRVITGTLVRDSGTQTESGLTVTSLFVAVEGAKIKRPLPVIADGENAAALRGLKAGDRITVSGETKLLPPSQTPALAVIAVISLERQKSQERISVEF